MIISLTRKLRVWQDKKHWHRRPQRQDLGVVAHARLGRVAHHPSHGPTVLQDTVTPAGAGHYNLEKVDYMGDSKFVQCHPASRANQKRRVPTSNSRAGLEVLGKRDVSSKELRHEARQEVTGASEIEVLLPEIMMGRDERA